METLADYFERADTPSAGSPVGVLMLRIIKANAATEPEQARAEAVSLLQKASRRKVYKLPRVLSQKQRTADDARFAVLRAKRKSSLVDVGA